MGDPFGLSPVARRAGEQANAAPALGDIQVVSIAADPDNARVVDQGRYCPGALPCLGRPAVGIVVPIRQNGGAVVDEVPATYCPLCKGWRADERETL